MSDRRANLHQVLRQRICLLDYAPGTRLSETDLAQEFGTSRTPLRRALARLEDEQMKHRDSQHLSTHQGTGIHRLTYGDYLQQVMHLNGADYNFLGV